MNRRMLIALLAVTASTLTIASANEADKWIIVGESGTDTFSIKKDSFENTTTKGGEEIAVVIGRSVSTKTKQISLEKWYVRVADCRAGCGQLATLSIDGEFRYENPWLEDGGSIASSIADVICSAHARISSEEQSKSI